MSDLVEWLTSILDEDEKRVRDAIAPSEWGGTPKFYGPDTGAYRDDWGLHTYHVAPERVLADIAAKRAILRLHAAVEGDRHCGVCMLTAPCRTLRLLASAYADRPGYDENWRP